MEQELNNLATKMFKLFARFEYSLKAAGFHQGEGNARANWQTFSETVVELFDDASDPELEAALNYIIEHPPKKQVVINGLLEWANVPAQGNSRSDRVLEYVRRVRNNLFHGGKFNGHWFAPERSELLLRHSITILEKCRDRSDAIREAYGDG